MLRILPPLVALLLAVVPNLGVMSTQNNAPVLSAEIEV
jgi:hypothetical protein